ncbi:MAG: hypothetical protein E6I88_07045 [Chloroflexi bacterium]|nr:MAG: hypothetical protein E6I88_07045 [Chloroflexota bacterium]
MIRVREQAREQIATARLLIGDRGSVPATKTFEWTVVALCTWLMTGAYLDAWAHRHLARLETFFTPWHAVLYSGMFAVLTFLAVTALRIEVSLAALVSPPHLLLMLALGMIVTGPLRAAWKRAGKRAPWTAVISATLLLSMFTFFDQFDQPLVNVWAAGQVFFPDTLRYTEELGILGIMVQTALLTGVVLYLLSRFTLPFGSITLLAGLNGILLGSLAENFNLIPVAILGGLLADLVMLWLRPGPQRITALRLAAVIGPVGVSSLYLLAVQLTQGIAWPVTLWLGSIVVSGAIGLLLSYLAVQPPAPQPD